MRGPPLLALGMTSVKGRHRFGTADVEVRPELEAPAAVACTTLFCATRADHPLCIRDAGPPR